MTTYTYSTAGDLAAISHSDGTPGVTFAQGRNGQAASVAHNGSTYSYAYNDFGQVKSESVSGGLLGGVGLTHDYDALRKWGQATSLIGRFDMNGFRNTRFLGLTPRTDPEDGITDFAAGGADIASAGLSNLARGGMGTNGYVDKDTGAYTAGQITGGALVMANLGSSLFNGGAQSALWTGGATAEGAAAQAGARGLTTVGMTAGGRYLLGPNTPRWLAAAYSGIFAANARGGITVFTCGGELGEIYLLERLTMRILNNAFIGRGIFY